MAEINNIKLEIKDNIVSTDNLNIISSENLINSRKRISYSLIIVVISSFILIVLGVINDRKLLNDSSALFKDAVTVNRNSLLIYTEVENIYSMLSREYLSGKTSSETKNDILDSVNRKKNNISVYSEVIKNAYHKYPQLEYDLSELDNLIVKWDYTIDNTFQLLKQSKNLEADDYIHYKVKTASIELNTLLKNNIISDDSFAGHAYSDIVANATKFHLYNIIITIVLILCKIFLFFFITNTLLKSEKFINITHLELSNKYKELEILDDSLINVINELDIESKLLKKSELRFSHVLESISSAIWEYDLATNDFFCSHKLSDVTTYYKDDFFSREFVSQLVSEEYIEKIDSFFDRKVESINEDFKILTKQDSYKWLNINAIWTSNKEGIYEKAIGSITDISEKKTSEEYLNFLFYYDELTGLNNRHSFTEYVETTIVESLKKDKKFAVLFLDIDDFKLINDTYGHVFGDRVLLVIAKHLTSIRQNQLCTNSVTFARFGGDEFLMLIEDIDSYEDVVKYANMIMDLVRKPVKIQGQKIHNECSIGASIFPADGTTASALLKNADVALHKSKELGKNRISFFNKHLYDSLLRKNDIVLALRKAISNNTLFLLYQPQWSLKDNKVSGYEALLRLNDTKLGMVMPNEFIPIAEQTGFIIPIGYWIIRETIKCYIRMKNLGFDMQSVSINISEVQLNDPHFTETVRKILINYNFDGSKLNFEITEGILLSDLDKKLEIFKAIRALGISIELDDFGTGYSSLNYLMNIKFDSIKIDKSFIDGICVNKQHEELLGIVVRLCTVFNSRTIAEGVENIEQYKFLKKLNCQYIQGYLFSKPINEESLIEKEKEINKRKEEFIHI